MVNDTSFLNDTVILAVLRLLLSAARALGGKDAYKGNGHGRSTP
jgi:hypothetical protein